jgi:hypothetical protein
LGLIDENTLARHYGRRQTGQDKELDAKMDAQKKALINALSQKAIALNAGVISQAKAILAILRRPSLQPVFRINAISERVRVNVPSVTVCRQKSLQTSL